MSEENHEEVENSQTLESENQSDENAQDSTCCDSEEICKEVDFEEKYLRLLAEMENSRKRMQKEKQQSVRFAIENAISEFLPIMDNFENALKFAGDNSSKELQNWASGFQMILAQFKDLLHNHGIVAFHSEGNQFDPHCHEAIEIEETEEQPEGMILQEFAKGYKSQQRTIRPAKVKVARKPALCEQPSEEEDKLQTKES